MHFDTVICQANLSGKNSTQMEEPTNSVHFLIADSLWHSFWETKFTLVFSLLFNSNTFSSLCVSQPAIQPTKILVKRGIMYKISDLILAANTHALDKGLHFGLGRACWDWTGIERSLLSSRLRCVVLREGDFNCYGCHFWAEL